MTALRTLAVAAATAALAPAFGQEKPTLYVVPYAHLDTQWRWSYPQVVREFLWNTMEDNLRLFAKYPDYTFNFGGSRRFELMSEYFPGEYAKVVDAVRAGRWFPAPASVDETECNILSGESVIRNVLYGNLYSKREFGVTSDEFMRPDSFGFPYSLPTLLAHAGVKGFSTQKLTWGSSVGIPFNVGLWEGPDGSAVLSALNATSYTSDVRGDLSHDDDWLKRVAGDPVPMDYRYFGTGDRGGAPDESSVANAQKSVRGDGPLKVVQGPADAMFKALTPEQIAKLPRYKGELLLTQHSAGSLSSHAEMKRWNRASERLADLAERTSVAAALVAGTPYPMERIARAWDLVLGSQMHDMLPGTCLPKAYEYAQNDEIVAQKSFADVATGAVGAVAARMDTRAKGVALVVVNPLSVARNDVVEAWVPARSVLSPHNVETLCVRGPDGTLGFAQMGELKGASVKVIFRANVPANGFATFDVLSAPVTTAMLRSLPRRPSATGRKLENERFKVTLNAAGDLESVYDKINGRESLLSPATLDLQRENPAEYPAWNMDWDDQRKPPYASVGGRATVTVVESGPIRSTIEVARESNGSTFVQRYSLTQGGDRLEIRDDIDWGTRETALKAAFPLATANPDATYGMQVGAIERGNNEEKKYEVPLHGWMDLTSPDGKYGVGVLTTDKYGADKPSDDTLRLTLLYTPGTRGGYEDQGVQDFGRHSILYGLAPHAGDWRKGGVAWNAARLGQPLRAFVVPPHAGALGRSFSVAQVADLAVEIMALKRAEDGDGYIVRLRELTGEKAEGVGVRFAAPVVSAQEVDGQERSLGSAKLQDGKLVAAVPGYGLRSYRVRLGATPVPSPVVRSVPLALAYDADVVSTRAKDADGEFAGGRSMAAETLPATLALNGVDFRFGSTADGAKNALVARGQTLALPKGTARVEVLAAATQDTLVHFGVGGKAVAATIPAWNGYVGQWDVRLWKGEQPALAYGWPLPWDGLAPGYVKGADLAYCMTHTHAAGKGDAVYEYAYLFRTTVAVPSGATTLTVPNDPHVRIFAATAVGSAPDAVSALPLVETLADHVPGGTPKIVPTAIEDDNGTSVALVPPLYWHGGGLRFTLDGSTPTAVSPSYDKPIFLFAPTTVKVALFDADGRLVGSVATQKVDAHDTRRPGVAEAMAFPGLDAATVTFSETIDRATAEDPHHYRFDSGEAATKAVLRTDGRTVDLVFDAASRPLTTIETVGVRDLAGNEVESTKVALQSVSPVFVAPPLEPSKTGVFETAAPTTGGSPWTVNLWLLIDRQPDDRTIIAGFGSSHDGARGRGRYLAKFRNGLQFWSANEDVPTRTALDVRKWQMLTATYDGGTVRVFKNGVLLASRQAALQDDVSTANVLPLDPWDRTRKLDGEVRGFTIWPGALPPTAVERLYAKGQG